MCSGLSPARPMVAKLLYFASVVAPAARRLSLLSSWVVSLSATEFRRLQLLWGGNEGKKKKKKGSLTSRAMATTRTRGGAKKAPAKKAPAKKKIEKKKAAPVAAKKAASGGALVVEIERCSS